MNKALLTQLALLNIDNDDHWTADGMPRLDALKELSGQAITRDEIKLVAPKFSRKNPNLNEEPVAQVQAPIWGEQVADVDLDAGKDDGDQELLSETDKVEHDHTHADVASQVRTRLEKASAELEIARNEFEEANADNDALIMHEAATQGFECPMQAVKKFQESQTHQRTINAQRNQALKQILSPKEFQALMKS